MADPENHDTSPKRALNRPRRDEFKKRLDNLGEKLDKATVSDRDEHAQQSSGSGLGIAMRMGTEFVVSILIGGAIGWYLDMWMGSTPFMLFLFVMFGFAAGTMNILRAGKQIELAKNQEASDEANDLDKKN